MHSGDYAWTILLIAVLGYELTASELLSEAMDRYRRRHPVLVTGGILLVALHLTRWIPARIDPLHQMTRLR